MFSSSRSSASLYAVSAVLGLLRKKRELSDVFALLMDHLLKEKGGILYRNGVTQSEALRPGQLAEQLVRYTAPLWM
ncbi:hypothetical protein PISMIDRAFT_675819 [Pisolithus microcarpus 441]|uniref:Uncharacterized protein n=1 Tax=Pisolithus microcarpus 441 TaxID=765257 RepID=A0A0C9ZW86_9AGAM|nr:hypothetical protein PISMIDRAFT_675819 [Pisolithus microcarpus 441]